MHSCPTSVPSADLRRSLLATAERYNETVLEDLSGLVWTYAPTVEGGWKVVRTVVWFIILLFCAVIYTFAIFAFQLAARTICRSRTAE